MDKGERVAVAEMTGTRELYNEWAATYDAVENPTRDLEKRACQSVLGGMSFGTVIELGSGTGKNTGWLADRAKRLVSVDLSPEMQAVAREKVQADNVEFRIGNVAAQWDFAEPADLITCSLILEHVENLDHVFSEAAKITEPGGRFYVCELHPFKQYTGSKARFETGEGLKVLACFVHHLTDYTDAAISTGFAVEQMDEWFDGDERTGVPRLISFLFSKR